MDSELQKPGYVMVLQVGSLLDMGMAVLCTDETTSHDASCSWLFNVNICAVMGS